MNKIYSKLMLGYLVCLYIYHKYALLSDIAKNIKLWSLYDLEIKYYSRHFCQNLGKILFMSIMRYLSHLILSLINYTYIKKINISSQTLIW